MSNPGLPLRVDGTISFVITTAEFYGLFVGFGASDHFNGRLGGVACAQGGLLELPCKLGAQFLTHLTRLLHCVKADANCALGCPTRLVSRFCGGAWLIFELCRGENTVEPVCLGTWG